MEKKTFKFQFQFLNVGGITTNLDIFKSNQIEKWNGNGTKTRPHVTIYNMSIYQDIIEYYVWITSCAVHRYII